MRHVATLLRFGEGPVSLGTHLKQASTCVFFHFPTLKALQMTDAHERVGLPDVGDQI